MENQIGVKYSINLKNGVYLRSFQKGTTQWIKYRYAMKE